ncbi:thiol:disulfide interchange protein DsbG [Pandoraea terrae]|uniref:Thiol:disulfide interchange protein n=1 Tax=Pandoraea terrae TaxID=1537710 RepID=A0A5E4Y2U9_9BURK|nr:thiol:disulfide interchange protein DsbG [Pandoraea terrae]VVE43019.1 thiol:disulfide interchange protein DsbG [Pandoraea terrae]
MNRYVVPVALCGSIAVFVALLSNAASSGRPPVLAALESRGVSNLHEFKVNGGLRGFAGVAGQNPVAVYVTKDGDVIIGARVDRNGEPMDTKVVDELVAGLMGNAAWRQLESARWIRDGREDAPRTVYVITDPNCPWCHRLWEAARPWVQSGKVQLRELLVGVIRPDSEGKAATILSSSNPSAALEQNERDFDKGGVSPATTVSDDVKRTLSGNLKLMEGLGFQGTPGVIYKSADGKVEMLSGFPQGTQLSAVMGPR